VVDITDEVRLKVHREDCEKIGHSFDIDVLLTPEKPTSRPDGPPIPSKKELIASRDDTKFPHIPCTRCGLTYIVFPFAGSDYEDAERQVYEFLKVDSSLAKDIVRNRGKRTEKKNQKERPSATNETKE
jgi:hypothetical protein